MLQSRGQGVYVTPRLLNVALSTISVSINYSATFKVLKPHVSQLISDIVFPYMCLQPEDEELWNTDPEEYVRRTMDVVEDVHSPANAAGVVIIQLVKKRTKTCLQPALAFCSQVLAECTTVEQYSRKFGALSLVISLKEKLKDPAYAEQVAFMLAHHVVPEFDSLKGVLRAKACILSCEYAEFATKLSSQGKPEIFDAMLSGVIRSLQDKEMPVRVDAATALGAFVENEAAVEKLRPNLGQLLSVLFEMINSAGNEEVIETLGLIAENFKEDMAPYAVQMVTLLCQTFQQMVSSMGEGDDDDNDGDDGDGEENMMAIIGCIRVIHSVLEAVQDVPEIWPSLEAPLVPMLSRLFQSDGVEFLEESLDILEALVKFTPVISPALWGILTKVIEAHQSFAYDYLENMLPIFDKFMARGTDILCSPQAVGPQDYHQMFFTVITSILRNEDAAEQDCYSAVWLACAVLQHCNGKMDSRLAMYLELAVQELRKEIEADKTQGANELKGASLKRMYFNLIANCIIYNPVLTHQLLETSGCTGEIYGTWFKMMFTYEDAESREKKTTMMAFSNIMQLPADKLPVALQAELPRILDTMVWLCGLVASETEEDEEDGGKDGDEEEEDFNDEDIDDEEDIAGPRGFSELDFAKMFGDDDDFDGDEGDKLPMDDVDILVAFTNMMQTMQTSHPDRFNSLYGQMNPEAKARLEAVVQAGQS